MRNKKDKVDRRSKIAFYPLKRHFSISGFLRLIDKKGRKKAYDLDFLAKDAQLYFD